MMTAGDGSRRAEPRRGGARRQTQSPARRRDPLVPGDLMWLVRKSAGFSSRQSLDRVARSLGRRDVGHAGTLDPFATGLLLLVAGRATRLVPWIQAWPKEYWGAIRLGVATDTLDGTGRVTETKAVPPLTRDELERAAAGLTGRILQVPPMFSAVHSDGERLYNLARRGVEVERVPRERDVALFELREFTADTVTVRVICSSGTYVRGLAESFGAALGLPAHLAGLDRTRIGPWAVENARGDDAFDGLTPTEVAAAAVPLADILTDWPVVVLPEDEATAVRNGRLPEPGAGERVIEGPGCRLTSRTGRLIALAERLPGGAPRLLRVFDSGAAETRT